MPADPYIELLNAAADVLYRAAAVAETQHDQKRANLARDYATGITAWFQEPPPQTAAPPTAPAPRMRGRSWDERLTAHLQREPRNKLGFAAAANKLGMPADSLREKVAGDGRFLIEPARRGGHTIRLSPQAEPQS